jgi:acyl-CoA thioesterase
MTSLVPDVASRHVDADPWAGHLGISVDDEGGRPVFRMTLSDDHLNFLGGGHGGAVYSLAATAFAAAAAAHGPGPTLLDTHLALTAGGRRDDVMEARVETVGAGRRLGTFRVTVTRTDGRVAAVLTGTARYGAGR